VDKANEVGNDVMPWDETPARFKMDRKAAFEYVDFLAAYPLSKQVCICGHSIKSHLFGEVLGHYCKPGNIDCRCNNPLPVYCASDARFFKRSTHGFGRKHALGLGIASMEKRGGTGEWIIPLACSVPNCAGKDITVACVLQNGTVMNKTTQNSVFLCVTHVLELGGNRL
jgi:hypothetical protein